MEGRIACRKYGKQIGEKKANWRETKRRTRRKRDGKEKEQTGRKGDCETQRKRDPENKKKRKRAPAR